MGLYIYIIIYIYMDLRFTMKLQKYQTSLMIWNITSDEVLLTESEPTILMAEWLTKAQGRLFHEATRQSHPQALKNAIHCEFVVRKAMEVLYPFPFEEWITWFSFWFKAMKSGLLDLSGSLWIPKLQISQSFHSNGQRCISRGSIALQQHVRPSFWSSWWVVSWSDFRYCAYQIT